MTDREKLIELLQRLDSCVAEYCKDCEHVGNMDECLQARKEMIADHLLANGVAVQKHGRLEKSKHTKYYSGFDSEGDLVSWRDYPVLCSECHYDLTENGIRETNYCPNCGADMRGEV